MLVICSPTINEGVFPSVALLLSYLKCLHPLKKKGMAFGSYGWSGEATKVVEAEMKAMGIEVLEPALEVVYVPWEEELQQCMDLGERIAGSVWGKEPMQKTHVGYLSIVGLFFCSSLTFGAKQYRVKVDQGPRTNLCFGGRGISLTRED